jgi:UPF0755 protein
LPQGATGRDIGRLLAEQKLIEYEGFFRLAIQVDRSNKPIKHGAYELYKGLSALDLLHLLHEGPSRHLLANQVRVTIPEGLSISQTAELLQLGETTLQRRVRRNSSNGLALTAENLEGFLMPNTYFFDEQPKADALAERMVQQFEKEYDKLLKAHPGARHLDKRYVVTLASIVERETKVDEERPLVAQVIYNRIKADMPLQMDSTMQFALNKYGERMLYEDMEKESPYNTYMNPGAAARPDMQSRRKQSVVQPWRLRMWSICISYPMQTEPPTPSARPWTNTIALWPGIAQRLPPNAGLHNNKTDPFNPSNPSNSQLLDPYLPFPVQ